MSLKLHSVRQFELVRRASGPAAERRRSQEQAGTRRCSRYPAPYRWREWGDDEQAVRQRGIVEGRDWMIWIAGLFNRVQHY